MKTFLESKATTDEGKKSILFIYYALKSKHSNNDAIFRHLEAMQNGNLTFNQLLDSKAFKFHNKVQRLITFLNYKKYNTISFPSFPQKPSSVMEQSEKDIAEEFKTLKLKIGSRLTNEANVFIWITKHGAKDLSGHLADMLGLSSPNEHWVAITLPETNDGYELFYPTFIEAEFSSNDWFYANSDKDDSWGKTINITKIVEGCAEKDFAGLPEALTKPKMITDSTTTEYLGKVDHHGHYYTNQYKILSQLISSNYYNDSMINHIIDEYYKWYGGVKC